MRFEDTENATEFLRDNLKIDKLKRIREFALTPDEFNHKFEPTTAELPDEIQYQCPILCAAIFYNAMKCFEFLSRSAKLTATDSWQAGPVHFAARMGRLEILKHPALSSANFLARDFCHRTAAHYASQFGRLECLKFLTDEKAVPIEGCDRFGMTVSHIAFEANQVEIVRFILQRYPIDTIDKFGRTPAGIAAEKGHLEVLRICSQDVLASIDGKGRNLIHLASKSGLVEEVNFLKDIDRIDLNKLDDRGFAPIHYAAEYNHTEVLKCLLRIERVNRELPDARGNRAIHIAAEVGAVEALTVLISRNPDENNVKNGIGRSPLFLAVANGQIAAVRELIRAGGNSKDTDQNGVTIQDVLKGCWASEIAGLLDGRYIEIPDFRKFYEVQEEVPLEPKRGEICNVS